MSNLESNSTESFLVLIFITNIHLSDGTEHFSFEKKSIFFKVHTWTMECYLVFQIVYLSVSLVIRFAFHFSLCARVAAL